jgi:hypothetical protein
MLLLQLVQYWYNNALTGTLIYGAEMCTEHKQLSLVTNNVQFELIKFKTLNICFSHFKELYISLILH